MTRVYDLHGNRGYVTDEEPDEVFVAAAVHAHSREAVFVVTSRGHQNLVDALRENGIDVIQDEVLDEYDTALIVAGDVTEWADIRKELDT